jgi:hypothetical protein
LMQDATLLPVLLSTYAQIHKYYSQNSFFAIQAAWMDSPFSGIGFLACG